MGLRVPSCREICKTCSKRDKALEITPQKLNQAQMRLVRYLQFYKEYSCRHIKRPGVASEPSALHAGRARSVCD